MHHNKLQAVNASNDNLAAGSAIGATSGSGGGNGSESAATSGPQQPQHCALSREASLKKGSDGKGTFLMLLFHFGHASIFIATYQDVSYLKIRLVFHWVLLLAVMLSVCM